MKKQILDSYYVKHPVHFLTILSPDENAVLEYILHVDNMNSAGRTWRRYKKDDWYTRTNVSRYSFNRCVKRLIEIGLVYTKKKISESGGYIDYFIDFDNYNLLVEIVNDIKYQNGLAQLQEKYFPEHPLSPNHVKDITNEDICSFSACIDAISDSAENDHLLYENGQLSAENDHLLDKNTKTTAENDQMTAENDHLLFDRKRSFGGLTAEFDTLVAENSKLNAKLDQMTSLICKILRNQGEKLDDQMIVFDTLTAKNDHLDCRKRSFGLLKSTSILKNINKENKKNETGKFENGENERDVLSEKEPNLLTGESSDSFSNSNSSSFSLKDNEDESEDVDNGFSDKINNLSEKQKEKIAKLLQDVEDEFPVERYTKDEIKKLLEYIEEQKEYRFGNDKELLSLTNKELFPYSSFSGHVVYLAYYEEDLVKIEEIRSKNTSAKTMEERLLEFEKIEIDESYYESEDVEALKRLTPFEQEAKVKEWFRSDNVLDYPFDIKEAKNAVVRDMRFFNLPSVDNVMYDDPMLLQKLFPEIIEDKETKGMYLRSPKKPQEANYTLFGDNFKEVKLKSLSEPKNASDYNDYIELVANIKKLPKRVIVSSGRANFMEIGSIVLTGLGFKEGDFISDIQMKNILDACAAKYIKCKIEQNKGSEVWKGCHFILDPYHHDTDHTGMVKIQNLDIIKNGEDN